MKKLLFIMIFILVFTMAGCSSAYRLLDKQKPKETMSSTRVTSSTHVIRSDGKIDLRDESY